MATTAPAFGLSAIGQIFVTVHDVERAVAFYRDTLGMQFLFQAPPGMAFFNCGGVRLMLGVPTDPQFDHPASIIYYKVADIEAAYETLKSRGARLSCAHHGDVVPQAVLASLAGGVWCINEFGSAQRR